MLVHVYYEAVIGFTDLRQLLAKRKITGLQCALFYGHIKEDFMLIIT